jgi:toxin-antitoxin system PIN domain toxin
VILVDTNLLVYARLKSFSHNSSARAWLDGRLNGSAPLALPWASLLGFVRITTNRRIFERPLALEQAWQQVTEWLACPPVWVPSPGDRHAAILGGLLLGTRAAGNLAPDAHLAALAIEHGLRLCSTDGDFARFEGLTWENPLAG